MATEQKNTSQVDTISSAYLDKEYQQKKGTVLGILGKSNFLDALSRNAGMINGTLAAIVVTGLVMGSAILTPTLITSLIGVALTLASFSAYASYKNEKMNKEAGYNFDEARMVASTRVGAAANIEIAKENAHALAHALTDTLGKELKDIKNESCQTQTAVLNTQAAVVDLQKKMLSWQEREAAKEPPVRILQ